MRLFVILAIACVSASAQQPACSLDGAVVNRITHEPVPRARVTVGNASTTADNSGHWSFANAPCARGLVVATRFGFLDGAPQPVELVADSPVHGVTLELTPQAVITGKVIDENGDPATGMPIVAWISRIVDGKHALRSAPRTTTNDLGEFRIAPLEAGRYVVCAQPGLGRTEYQDACYPEPVESGVAGSMALSPGQETHIELALSIAPRARVSGTLGGVPPGARPALQMARQVEVGARATTISFLSAFAAPDGKFTVESVPPGSYLLTAMLTQDGQFHFARMPVEVGGADIDNLSLTLEPAITISGNIVAPSPSTDSPPRIQVALHSSEPNASMGRVEWSDDYRSFAIRGVSPGNYTLVVSSGDYFVKSATLDGQDIAHGEFNINGAPGPIEIVLSNEGGSIEGDVVLDDGTPAPVASVMLFRNGILIRNARQGGHFQISNLEPGDYTAYAWDSDQEVAYAEPDWMRQYAGTGVAVTVKAGQNARIRLTRLTAPPEF